MEQKHENAKEALGLKFECVGQKIDVQKLSKFFQTEDRHFKANYKKWLEEAKLDPSSETREQEPTVILDEFDEAPLQNQDSHHPNNRSQSKTDTIPQLEFKKNIPIEQGDPEQVQVENKDLEKKMDFEGLEKTESKKDLEAESDEESF